MEGVKTEERGIPIWGSKLTLEFVGKLVQLTELASIQPLLRSTFNGL